MMLHLRPIRSAEPAGDGPVISGPGGPRWWKLWRLAPEARRALLPRLEERGMEPRAVGDDALLFRSDPDSILALADRDPFRGKDEDLRRALRRMGRPVRSRFAPEGGGAAIMGVLNVTPDSFSDGGEFFAFDRAVERGVRLEAEGADLIDVGGESTRPGAEEVPAEQEIRRVIPVIRELRGAVAVPLSADTRKGDVARAALRAGATVLNDVTGLRHDPELARIAADAGADLVLNHIQGEPETMQRDPRYEDVVTEVYDDLARSAEIAIASGVAEDKIIIDPGIGFGKRLEDNLALLRHLGEFRSLGFPVLVGPSRKSFIGVLLGLPVEKRLEATLGACVAASRNGADILRVHDVRAVLHAVRTAEAIERTED